MIPTNDEIAAMICGVGVEIEVPDLASYDWLLVNSSAGKDSQAMLDLVVEMARAAGVADRIVVVHCDLGRVEWQGTRELAQRQAEHYGARFEVVSRSQGDLLDHVEARGMWPSSTARFCTSDHKRAQVRTLMTRLVVEWRQREAEAEGWTDGVSSRLPKQSRPCRILNCMGLRAEESPARAKKVAFERDEDASNGRRVVDAWLPILGWTVGEVWARIRVSGVAHHRAYDLGMKRLSCCFCIFAPEAALMIAGEHNRGLLAEYVRVEAKTGHAFRGSKTKKFHLAVIQDRLAAGERVSPEAAGDAGCWNM